MTNHSTPPKLTHEVGGAAKEIRQRHVDNCTKADPEYGAGIAAALGKATAGPTLGIRGGP